MDVNFYLSPSSTSQPGMFIFSWKWQNLLTRVRKRASDPSVAQGSSTEAKIHSCISHLPEMAWYLHGAHTPPPVHFRYTLNLLEITGNTQDNRLLCEQSHPGSSRAQRQGEQLCVFRSVVLAKYSSCVAGWFQARGTQNSRRLMVWRPTNSLGFRNIITSCPSGQTSGQNGNNPNIHQAVNVWANCCVLVPCYLQYLW